MNPYQKFCVLRDQRRAGEEAPEYTEREAFDAATLGLAWQPIATAPKNTHIIGYWAIYKRPLVMWWNVADGAFETLMDRNEQPTHWMPLPGKPE